MALLHYLRNMKYQEMCTPSTPPPVTDTILEKRCMLEGSIIALLRALTNFKLRRKYEKHSLSTVP